MIRSRGVGDTEACGGEGGTEFGDEFFGGVGVIAESLPELSVESCPVAGPVDQFVEDGGVVVLGVAVLVDAGDLDAVDERSVFGAVPAVVDEGSGGGDGCLGSLDRIRLLTGIGGRWLVAVDLGDVEDREDPGDEVGPLRGVGFGVVGVVGLGDPLDASGAAFASLDLGAELLLLFVGGPRVVAVVLGQCFNGENDDVAAGVGSAGGGVDG